MTPDRTTDPSVIRSSWDEPGWDDGTRTESGPVSDARAPDVPTPPVEAHDAQACRDIAAAATRERGRLTRERDEARAKVARVEALANWFVTAGHDIHAQEIRAALAGGGDK